MTSHLHYWNILSIVAALAGSGIFLVLDCYCSRQSQGLSPESWGHLQHPHEHQKKIVDFPHRFLKGFLGLLYLPCLLWHRITRVGVEEVDGNTLLNNRKQPPHTMKDIVGKFTIGENDTIGLLPIYHLQLLMQINEIAEAFLEEGGCLPVRWFLHMWFKQVFWWMAAR